jgi:hypothetical protein
MYVPKRIQPRSDRPNLWANHHPVGPEWPDTIAVYRGFIDGMSLARRLRMNAERGPLPLHRSDGTLPPTSAVDGRFYHPSHVSPYLLTMPELIARFGTSAHRLALLAGLLELRRVLRDRGVLGGFHWIGGSFVRAGGRPRDIDLACFLVTPEDWSGPVREQLPELSNDDAKERYGCDVRFVDLRDSGIIRWTVYWSQVFSSCKPIDGNDPETHYDRRLGFLEVPIATRDEDAAARAALEAQRRQLGCSS